MAEAAGGESEDDRCRLLVRLADPAAVTGALERLAAADRLAGVIAAGDAAAALAARLPTALLREDEAPGDGHVVQAHDGTGPIERRRQRQVGEPPIIVADVGASRHAAMEAGEAGADVVLFTGEFARVRDCVAWWCGLFVLPVAVPADLVTAESLAAAGADLLVVEAGALADPEAWLDALARGEAARPTALL